MLRAVVDAQGSGAVDGTGRFPAILENDAAQHSDRALVIDRSHRAGSPPTALARVALREYIIGLCRGGPPDKKRNWRERMIAHAEVRDAPHPSQPISDTEAYEVLLARASGNTGSIPPSLLVKHVLGVTSGADWPVQSEAMEALLRRLSFGRRDELVVASRPPQRRSLGLYQTRRKGSRVRPYRSVLESVEPLSGSCDCPDFLRSSLGLCKHLLAILEELASKPRKWKRALSETAPTAPQRLRWDPVRPLSGIGDPLAQVRWVDGAGLHGNDQRGRKARKWFAAVGGRDLALKASALGEPRKRQELVADLLAVARPRGQSAALPDPALVSLLELEKSRLRRVVGEKIDRRSLLAALRTLRRTLYPYQLEGVERFLAVGRLLLADDMGLGKTAQAVASCHVTWKLAKVRRGLIVVPASLKPQWEREWQLFSDAPVSVVDGAPAERAALYRSTQRGFLITNYEQVIRDLDLIRGWQPGLVVLDEAQRIKNWATKTAAYVKTLDPDYRLVLTGTPMENRLEELASVLDWVDDLALEPKWRLVPWHTTFADGRREVAGARNLDTLRSRIAGCMLRRHRKDVLRQLPPRSDVRVPVEMVEQQREEHDALIQPIASILRRSKTRPLTQAEFLKLMQMLATQRVISNGIAQFEFEAVWPEIEGKSPTEPLLRSLGSPKLVELREIVRRLVVDQSRKVVVFSQWRRMLKLAHWATSDILAGAGLRSVFFTGREGQRRRTQNIVEFHDDPKTRLLFASDAGGVGLNLQRAANGCINLELPWNPAVLEQRIGRIYRLGQKRPIDVFNLVTENGIEARIAGLVATKRALFDGLFDGKSDAVTFEHAGSFLSRIEKVVEVPEVPEVKGSDDGAVDDTLEDRELETILNQADESKENPTHERETEAARERQLLESGPDNTSVGALFSQLQVERQQDGAIRIEAPPEVAGALCDLFAGMAQLLRGNGDDPPSSERP